MGDKVRSFPSGRFLATIGGESVGFIKKISGGTVKGEVVSNDLGPDNVQKKHLATISHEPLTIEIGMGMGQQMYSWIQASFDKGHDIRDMEVVAADFDYKSMAVREMLQCYINELTVPALDGASKDAAFFTLKIDPEQIRYRKGDGNAIQGTVDVKQKSWLCSNFRLQLGDLPCQRVAKIDSFTWKCNTTKDEVGQFREYEKIPTKVEVPNLKITVSMRDWDAWAEKHQSFVIEGKCSEGDEMEGSITFLGPDMSAELGSIDLLNVGVISMEQEAVTANEDKVARFTMECYVEKMKFNYA